MGVSAVFLTGFSFVRTHASHRFCFFSPRSALDSVCFFASIMASPTSSVSTGLCSVENFAHNMWNLLLEMLCHEQISGAFELFVDEIDCARIALSFRFALDLLCYKGVHDSA